MWVSWLQLLQMLLQLLAFAVQLSEQIHLMDPQHEALHAAMLSTKLAQCAPYMQDDCMGTCYNVHAITT